MSDSFDEILIKFQKSIQDSFQECDENLRFSILTEILQCQNLLLEYNLKKKKFKRKYELELDQIKLNEIYDEW